jgi:xanthine dehydrogenase FAD-binding subunit
MVESFFPMTLQEALSIRGAGPVIPFAGGTDLMVRRRNWSGTLPRFDRPVLFLDRVKELREIKLEEGIISIGAGTTLAELTRDLRVPEILRAAAREMAAPGIRNLATLGGNICNASPAGDTLPPLYVLNAAVVLQNSAGQREIPVKAFLQGPGRTDLAWDELLVKLKIPAADLPSVCRYKKVGTRKADALSKASFAGLAGIAHGRITEVRIALGAVAPQIVRDREIEAGLAGKTLRELPGLIPELLKEYSPLLQPIDDQRSTAGYRRKVALRLIADFLAGVAEGGQP